MSAIRIAIVSALAVVSLVAGGVVVGRPSVPIHTKTLASPIECCDSVRL